MKMDNYPDTTWQGDPSAPWNQDYEEPEVDPKDEPLTDVERLAVAQAFYNAVGKMVATKDKTNLRGQVNAFFESEYERTGAKSFDVKLLGEKVGTYSLTIGKPKPQKVINQVVVSQERDLYEWAEANGLIETRIDMAGVQDYFEQTGEVPPGCCIEELVTPAEGAKITRSTLRVDAEAVLDAMGPRLEDAAINLLEEGDR